MSEKKLRQKNGRFVKKSVFERQLKATAMSKRLSAEKRERKRFYQEFPVQGRRIVDVKVLSEKMVCDVCKRGIALRNIEEESLEGLAAVWTIRCPCCLSVKKVETSDSYISLNSTKFGYDINCKAAAGTRDAGIGATRLNVLLNAMNIPGIEQETLQSSEKDVGPAFVDVANGSTDSCNDTFETEVLEKQKVGEPIQQNKSHLHQALNEIWPENLINRLAENSITWDKLQEVLLVGGETAVHLLLAEDVTRGKPRVTKSKKNIGLLIARLNKS